jgi:haloalkane dehalogenase
MHYIDEGQGPVVIFVHGNPTWSFCWRHLAKALGSTHRCIAMDHLGFGLSDKPTDPMSPAEHAENLIRLLGHLQVEQATLVVEDWGGPIGFAWALARPEQISGAVVFNSWLWSVKGDRHFERFSRVMGGVFGRFLTKRMNFFVRAVLPKAMAAPVPPDVWRHYRRVLSTAASRVQCALFPQQIIAASDWLEGLWTERHALAKLPALVVWGERDIAFRAKELARWSDVLPCAQVHRVPEAGHCPQETHADEVMHVLRPFMNHQ